MPNQPELPTSYPVETLEDVRIRRIVMKLPAQKRSAVVTVTKALALAGIIMSGHSFAQTSAVEGMIKDPTGRPIGGAQIRVEARNGTNWSRLVKADAHGHYLIDGLAPGATYRVTLVINGAAKASINNVLAKSGATQLNFDLR